MLPLLPNRPVENDQSLPDMAFRDYDRGNFIRRLRGGEGIRKSAWGLHGGRRRRAGIVHSHWLASIRHRPDC